MLNFDSTHKTTDLTLIQNKLNKEVKIATARAMISSLLFFSGCSKTVDCYVKEPHAHRYVNEDGLSIYIVDEHEKFENYSRQDLYEPIDQDDIGYYKFIKKQKLINYVDNKEIIDGVIDQLEDYIEYRYVYLYNQPKPIIIPTGKAVTVSYSYSKERHYSWTPDKDHAHLTGETRVCHYKYEAFKVAKNANGEYVLLSSGFVDDLNEVVEEYPLIRSTFYKVVDLETSLDLDYEDMENDNPAHILKEHSTTKTK